MEITRDMVLLSALHYNAIIQTGHPLADPFEELRVHQLDDAYVLRILFPLPEMIQHHLAARVSAPEVHGGVPGAVLAKDPLLEEPDSHHDGVAGIPRIDPVLLDHGQPLGSLHLVEHCDGRMIGLLGPFAELLEAPILQRIQNDTELLIPSGNVLTMGMLNFSGRQGSQGRMVIGQRLFRSTVCAASGSEWKLNSAAREELPTPW